MANIEKTGALGAPGLTEITESVNRELLTHSVTRSGQVSKVPERFRDYICSKVKYNVTQELRPSTGVHLIPDSDIIETGKSSPLAAALEYCEGLQPQPPKTLVSYT